MDRQRGAIENKRSKTAALERTRVTGKKKRKNKYNFLGNLYFIVWIYDVLETILKNW